MLKAARQASVVFSASSNSQRSFKKYMRIDSPLLNETGCYVQEHPITDKSQKETFDVLWVGKMDFRKQLALALQTMASIGNNKFRLHIVGGGDSAFYQQMAEGLGIADQCVWHGAVSHDEVQKLMQASDVFFFTSVAEGTPHVVLEAIGNHSPCRIAVYTYMADVQSLEVTALSDYVEAVVVSQPCSSIIICKLVIYSRFYCLE